jgi:uncharacterized membrane protein
MPYRWNPPDQQPRILRLWPHQSLTAEGFVIFFGATFALMAVPLIALAGSPVLWVMLGFILLILGGMWLAIARNRRARTALEELQITPERIALVRHDAGRPARAWEANPYWVDLILHPTGGPVPQYLTLRGAGREVELGAFLTPEERTDLHGELRTALARLGPLIRD